MVAIAHWSRRRGRASGNITICGCVEYKRGDRAIDRQLGFVQRRNGQRRELQFARRELSDFEPRHISEHAVDDRRSGEFQRARVVGEPVGDHGQRGGHGEYEWFYRVDI